MSQFVHLHTYTCMRIALKRGEGSQLSTVQCSMHLPNEQWPSSKPAFCCPICHAHVAPGTFQMAPATLPQIIQIFSSLTVMAILFEALSPGVSHAHHFRKLNS